MRCFPHLTVEENILFGLKQRRMPKGPSGTARLNEITAQVDLGEHLPKLPNQLSGGQQQRVALGRALAVRPYVILFDEPLSNLDAKLREQVRYEIRKIQRDFGLTAIYVTHDQSEALAMSDRIFIMNRGRLEQSGAPEDIYHRPRTRFVADFVGSANVLDAEILEKKQPGLWRVKTATRRTRRCWRYRARAARPFPISWRPEAARLGDGQRQHHFRRGDPPLLPGPLYRPALYERRCRAASAGEPRRTVKEGDQVTFHIAPEDLVFLEPDA